MTILGTIRSKTRLTKQRAPYLRIDSSLWARLQMRTEMLVMILKTHQPTSGSALKGTSWRTFNRWPQVTTPSPSAWFVKPLLQSQHLSSVAINQPKAKPIPRRLTSSVSQRTMLSSATNRISRLPMKADPPRPYCNLSLRKSSPHSSACSNLHLNKMRNKGK